MSYKFSFPLTRLLASLRSWRDSADASEHPAELRAPRELRAFTRTQVAVTATVLASDGPMICGYTTDLGMKGLHIVCDQRIAVGSACQIMLLESQRRPEALLSSPQLSIEATGSVVRITDSGLAIEFTALIGKQSFERLRSLLLAHSGEADRIEGELQTAPWSYETHPLASPRQYDFPPPRQTLIKHQPREVWPAGQQRKDGQLSAVPPSSQTLNPEE